MEVPYIRSNARLSESYAAAPFRAHLSGELLLPLTVSARVANVRCSARIAGARFPAPHPIAMPKETLMAKGQKKSNKEIRKPKAEKPKTNASNPTLKADSMLGVEKKKR